MNSNIDEFIKDICDGECGEYFESSKAYCSALIKEALPPQLLSLTELDRVTQIKIARIASPLIRKNNQIDKNRFWILYYRLAEYLIELKCSQCKSHNQSLMCAEYILDRTIRHIKIFDVYRESSIFQKVRENLKANLTIHNNNNKIVTVYTQKINKRYTQDTIDMYRANAFIENALLQIDIDTIDGYSQDRVILKKEFLNRFKDSSYKKDIITLQLIEELLLMELLYEEKFFNYTNNHFIPKRFIDFIRRDKPTPTPDLTDENDSTDIDNILKEIKKETQLILKLKSGISLSNREFIKLVYQLDYKEIDVWSYFTDEEHLEIKLYARNGLDISNRTDKKISTIREKLKSNSYINIERETKRVTLLKLIYEEEMKSKEIGLLLNFTEKQINKKIENVKNKMKKHKDTLL